MKHMQVCNLGLDIWEYTDHFQYLWGKEKICEKLNTQTVQIDVPGEEK